MTIKSGMAPVHPGEILREELNDLGLSARALAKAIDVPVNRVTAILNGDRGITADTALRLGRYFDTTAQFWLNLQQAWQIRQAEIDAGRQIHERVTPHRTEVLREAARAARELEGISARASSAFGIIERNAALCDQLRAAERSFHILDENRQLLRALEGPLDELRRAGIFETALCHELSRTQQWLAEYSSRFQLPASGGISQLLAELRATSNVIFEDTALRRAIESMQNPWLDTANRLGSVQRLVQLQGIGELISHDTTFDPAVAENLRTSLGDWREAITWPEEIWTDLGARADFYADLGFDPDLTDLPAPAFREASEITTIQSGRPSLVEDYGSPEASAPDALEEKALARTREARDWLRGLEGNLRRFIDREMITAFGSGWPRRQLPDHKHHAWKSKKDAAERAGAPSRPLIAYADFTDYVPVICKRDHWETVFGPFFERPESIRESFQRLHPVRLDTMHARPITQDDELLLYVEAKRLLRRIAA